jgi:hypothetical protein
MLQIVSNLRGYSIEAKDGSIGTASDFLFDDSSMKVRWLVVDTGNWLTGRKVLIHPSAIVCAEHWRRELTVGLTKSQVKESPDIGQDLPVSLQMQKDLYSYYGWDSCAGGSPYGAGVYGGGLYSAGGETIASPLSPRTYFGANQAGEAERTTTHDVDPHLRSIVEVTGYHVHATDGSIGYVENFLVDSESWVIRYLTIDTSNWWFGQHVLISPHAVKEVDWTARYIRLDIARVQVKASPPWNPTIPIDEEFEEQLYSHYDWPSSERKSVFDSHQQRC